MTRDHGHLLALGALLALACARPTAPAPANPGSPTIAAGQDAAAQPSPPDPLPAAPLPQYCEDYTTCADERIRESDAFRTDGELSAEQLASLRLRVAEALEACRDTWDGLDAPRRAWLEACTDCGGSCDTYDCLVDVRTVEPGAVFECDIDPDAT